MPINEYDALIDESPAPQPVPDVNPDAPNEYDALIDTSPLFQVMTSAGLETDAGRAAKILHLQDRTRLPSAFISDNFDTVASEAQRLDFDPDKFRDSPAVKEWLSQKPEYASIVAGHPGELDRLVQMEQVIRADPKLRYRGKDFISRESADGAFAEDLSIQDFYRDYNLRAARGEIDASERRSNADELKKTYGPAHQIIAGVYQSWASTLSAVQTGPVDPSKFQPAADVTQASVDLDPSFTGTLLRGAGGLVGDVPLMLVGGPLAQGAETIGLFARLGKTAKAIGQTAVAVQPLAAREGVNTAREHGAWNGLAAWGIETVIPASFGKTGIERAIIGNLTREGSDKLRTGAALWLKQAGLEATEETVTEFAHAIHEAASGMDPDALSWNKLAPRLAAAGILGGVAGGVFNAPEALASIKEPGMPADRIDRQSVLNASVATVDQAKSYADRLRALGQMVGESQTNAAHGPSFDQLVEQAGGSNETLHFDPAQWNEYFQSKNLDPREMAQLVLENPDVYEESLATGAPMPVTLGKYLTALAVEHGSDLSALAKANPAAFSETEAAEEFQDLTNLPPEELDRIRSEIKAQASTNAKAPDPGVAIREKITEQLIAAGEDRSAAESHATIAAAGFVTLAERWNANAAAEGRQQITPDELLAKNFDRVVRDLPKLIQAGSTTTADALLDRLRAGDLPNEDTIYGPSLFEFLGKRGGVQDQGTELSSMAVDANRRPFQKKLIRKDGLTLDRAAEAAHEAGYIPSADINVLLEAINREASGEKVRIAGDIANEAQDAIRLQMLEWQEFLGNQGINLQDTSNEEIKALFYAPPDEQGGQEFAQTEPDAAPMADTIDIDGVQRSTLNSEGKRIGANEEQVRNFWKWFGDSKVVDTQGRPLVVYHGSPDARFVAADGVFKSEREKWGQGRPEAAHWFAASESAASTYANASRAFDYQNSDPAVIPAYLKLSNPLMVDGGGAKWRDAQKVGKTGDLIKEARSNGHDGAIVRNVRDDYQTGVNKKKEKATDTFTVFESAQIKSTGNRGTFDPSNPSILFQSSPAAAPDTAHLSPDAQAYVASLTPEQQQGLTDSIAYLKNHPDPSGDAGNLKMIAEFNLRRAAKVLNQTGDTKRGSIRFGETPEQRRAVITLFEQANLSTFIHESGHLFLEIFTDLAARSDAPTDFKADLGILLEWFGVDSVAKIGVDQHEQFARGFEAYAMEGNAPSVGMREIFRRFKGWLTAIYKAIKNLNVNLTPEVRGVMDRMLASQESILDAQRIQSVNALSRSVFTTDQEYSEYLESVAHSTEQAETSLRVELMEVERRAHQELYRDERKHVRGMVADEVDQQREFIAIAALQNGTRPDGQTLPDELRGLKLDRAELVATFGEDALQRLPGPKPKGKEARNNPNNRGPNVYRAEGGMPLAEAASLFGYRDIAELWEAMVNAPDRRKLIESKTNEIMRERFPDPMTNGSMDAKAMEALHGEHRSKLLIKEIRALSLRTGRTPAPLEIMRNLAIEQVGRQQIKDLRADRYQVAERKNARAVEEALANDDFDGAFIAKQRELLNHELYRAAVRAKTEAEKSYTYFKKLTTPDARKKIGLAGGWEWTVYSTDGTSEAFPTEEEAKAKALRDPGATWDQTSGYLDQIDGLMAKYEFKRVPNKVLKRRMTFADWVAARTEAGETVAIPNSMISGDAKNWRKMTVDELDALRDTVKNIETMAKLKNKLAANQAQRDFSEARNEVVSTIEGSMRKKPRAKGEAGRTFADKAKLGISAFLAAHRKMSSIALEADAGKEGGAFQRFIIDPVNAAGVAESERLSAEAIVFKAAADAHRKAGRKLREKVAIRSLGGEMLTLEERIMWALNWGNKGNRERLLLGEAEVIGKNHPEITEITEAMGQEVIDSLEQADWDFVNDILRQINSFWSEIASQERRMTGITPGKVAAEPFRTRLGIQPGGYFPISYDPTRSPKNRKSKISDDVGYVIGSAANKTTSHGHTNERTKGLGPLNISLDVASRHVTQVVHDLSFREPLADISKWLGDRAFRDAVHDHFGPAALEQMESWRGDMARKDISENPVDRTLRKVRNGVSLVTLGFNVGSAAVQIAGIGPSIQRVGAVNFARGFARLFSNPEATDGALNFIYEKSPFMKTRGNTMIREIRESVRTLRGKGWLDTMRNASYWMIAKAQIAVDAPTWMAAYEKSLAEGKDDGAAIKIADQVVADTQGSGLAADLSGVQRSRITQLFTVFFTPAAVTFNSSMNAIAQARRAGFGPQATAQLVMDMISIYAIPSAITVAIKAALGAAVGDDDEDKEGFGKKVLTETVGSVMNNFVGIRDLSGVLQGFNYSGPAGVRPLVDASRAIQQVGQLYDGEEGGFQSDQLDAALLKALVNVTGTWTHLPVRPVTQIIDGLDWAEEHDKNPILPVLLGKPRK